MRWMHRVLKIIQYIETAWTAKAEMHTRTNKAIINLKV